MTLMTITSGKSTQSKHRYLVMNCIYDKSRYYVSKTLILTILQSPHTNLKEKFFLKFLAPLVIFTQINSGNSIKFSRGLQCFLYSSSQPCQECLAQIRLTLKLAESWVLTS